MTSGDGHGRRESARCGAAAALLLACCSAALAAGPALEPDRLVWRELHYRARKFIFTAETTVRVEVVPAATAARHLVAAAGHAVVMPAGERLVRIELETTGLGRHTRNTAWLEPVTGAALQTTSQEFGRRARFKTQRFADAGVAVARYAPARGQEDQPADRWTQHADEFIPFPAVDRHGSAVSDSVALFWMLATCHLAKPGDSTQVLVTSRDQLLRVAIRVTATRPIRLDFDERTAAGSRSIDETAAGLEVIVSGSRFGQDADKGDLEFLGFRGNVRILLDPTRRVPVEISGSVPRAGIVTVRLQDVTLLR